MSVIVNIIGEKDNSDEYSASVRLKGIIESSVPNTALGEIVLYPSATLFGQAVKDVDIVMIGSLQNYIIKAKFNHDRNFIEEQVFIESFCTTIEIKSHPSNLIKREGTDWKVKYTSGWHNATKQSNDQKISARNFFKNSLGESPFITNLLWFTEISHEELSRLLDHNGNKVLSNSLPAFFDFYELARLLVLQRTPWSRYDKYFFECGFGGNSTDAYSNTLSFFTKARDGMGDLTRKKIEQITQTKLGKQTISFEENKLIILRGKAGTGKTIEIIQMAIHLVDEAGARVQILTFNRALVSDIRRLFALAELPDMFNEKCVSVNKMQSYFYGLINGCLYDGKLSGEEFLNRYKELLSEMIEFLESDQDARGLIKDICEDNPKLNWDYILIDEAQDWSSKERDLILLLFDISHILVADGGQQFVRTIEPCDWTVVSERNSVKLKYCLRQKNNLIKFINHYSSSFDIPHNKIITSEIMSGGKIVILQNYDSFYDIIKRELEELKKAGNIPYDMMFLIPPSFVKHGVNKSFKLIKDFEHHGILVWDGTNDENRLEYPVNPDETRVLQYESSRGLEGWTVCCLNFDEFLQTKELQYNPKNEGNALLLESAKDRKKKFMQNWALIPMTRAIDTLILALKDVNSVESKMLLELAELHSDFVEII